MGDALAEEVIPVSVYGCTMYRVVFEVVNGGECAAGVLQLVGAHGFVVEGVGAGEGDVELEAGT